MVRLVKNTPDTAAEPDEKSAGKDSGELPSYEDNEQSFADLQARIKKTLSFIEELSPAGFEGSDTREIVLRPGTPKEKKLSGQQYLLGYGLPQFFFHATTTYAILRHNGVEVGKGDFMGAY